MLCGACFAGVRCISEEPKTTSKATTRKRTRSQKQALQWRLLYFVLCDPVGNNWLLLVVSIWKASVVAGLLTLVHTSD